MTGYVVSKCDGGGVKVAGI